MTKPTIAVHVLNATSNGSPYTVGVYAEEGLAHKEMVGLVARLAAHAGLTITPPQRETLAASIALDDGFAGASYVPTGRADEVALAPVRKAIGDASFALSEFLLINEAYDVERTTLLAA